MNYLQIFLLLITTFLCTQSSFSQTLTGDRNLWRANDFVLKDGLFEKVVCIGNIEQIPSDTHLILKGNTLCDSRKNNAPIYNQGIQTNSISARQGMWVCIDSVSLDTLEIRQYDKGLLIQQERFKLDKFYSYSRKTFEYNDSLTRTLMFDSVGQKPVNSWDKNNLYTYYPEGRLKINEVRRDIQAIYSFPDTFYIPLFARDDIEIFSIQTSFKELDFSNFSEKLPLNLRKGNNDSIEIIIPSSESSADTFFTIDLYTNDVTYRFWGYFRIDHVGMNNLLEDKTIVVSSDFLDIESLDGKTYYALYDSIPIDLKPEDLFRPKAVRRGQTTDTTRDRGISLKGLDPGIYYLALVSTSLKEFDKVIIKRIEVK